MLDRIEAEGSHHAIGRALGAWGRATCHGYLVRTPGWKAIQAPESAGCARLMQQLTREHQPWVMEEIEGLAEGLDLPLDEVFAWNCRGDLSAHAPGGCTTVLAPGRLSHNEDGSPGFAGHCGMATVTPDTQPAFVSFVYPGSLPGHTFAVTEAGLAITVNNIRAHGMKAGLPRMVLTRAALAGTTADQVVDLLRASPRAGAFHVSVGTAGTGGMLSIEFAHPAVSVERVGASGKAHANHAIHAAMRHLPQTITASSAHRQARAETLLAEDRDALAILMDRGDAQEPIYRDSPEDTDAENTMATVDVDLSTATPDWTVHVPPRLGPRYRFRGLTAVGDGGDRGV